MNELIRSKFLFLTTNIIFCRFSDVALVNEKKKKICNTKLKIDLLWIILTIKLPEVIIMQRVQFKNNTGKTGIQTWNTVF